MLSGGEYAQLHKKVLINVMWDIETKARARAQWVECCLTNN